MHAYAASQNYACLMRNRERRFYTGYLSPEGRLLRPERNILTQFFQGGSDPKSLLSDTVFGMKLNRLAMISDDS